MIESLPEQVLAGLEAGLFHLSFYVALTMPDIGGAVEDGAKKTNAQRYKKWFETYASAKFQPDFNNFSADDCWKLRCSILHQGSTDHNLIVASSENIVVTSGLYGKKDKSLVIDVRKFCEHMAYAFYDWIELKKSDPTFALKRLEINDISRVTWKFS